MSRRSECDDVAAEEVTVTVLRSTGEKDEIPISMNRPLRDFKGAISKSSTLGRIPAEHQRLFHMGRELKTVGRSLEALGVGKFGTHVVHVFSTLPPGQHVSLLDNDDDEGDDDLVEVVAVEPSTSSKRSAEGPASTTVDLAGEESSDDDDDDCVVVLDQSSAKRQRRS